MPLIGQLVPAKPQKEALFVAVFEVGDGFRWGEITGAGLDLCQNDLGYKGHVEAAGLAQGHPLKMRKLVTSGVEVIKVAGNGIRVHQEKAGVKAPWPPWWGEGTENEL